MKIKTNLFQVIFGLKVSECVDGGFQEKEQLKLDAHEWIAEVVKTDGSPQMIPNLYVANQNFCIFA